MLATLRMVQRKDGIWPDSANIPELLSNEVKKLLRISWGINHPKINHGKFIRTVQLVMKKLCGRVVYQFELHDLGRQNCC